MSKTYTITDEDDGARLDRVIARRVEEIPHGVLQKMLRKKDIRLDGKKAEASTRVAIGQVIELRVDYKPPEKAPRERAKKERVELKHFQIAEAQSWVIHKDKEIIVINKPPGIATQGGTGITKHVDMMLPALQFDADAPPKLVHRIDKDTSGILILARSGKVATELQKLFAFKDLQKTYLALTVGVPQPYEGEITSKIEKASRDDYEKMRSGDDGKKAVTVYKVREALAGKFALVELMPITGRTHQLRVHMAEMNCPIMGDGKYGGEKAHVGGSAGISGKMHLHAWKVELPAFMGRKPMTLEAELPEHFKRALEIFELSLDE
jgi:23S rRNA pseudouridine955/2504/2580 synthase